MFQSTAIRLVAILLFVSSVSACSTGQGTDVDTRTGPSKSYTMDQFMKTISVRGNSFNHDETRLLVSTNESGVFQVYELELATGSRTPITSGEETTFAVAYMPNDNRILFTRDKDGSENNHLYLRKIDGTVLDLTEGDETKERFAGFHPDLESFHTLNNQRDPRFFDLFEWDVLTLEKSLVYQNDEGLDPSEVTPDGRWLVLTRTNTSNDSDIYVLDLHGSDGATLISEHEGQASFQPQSISPDGRHLYYSTNTSGEFLELKRYEFAENSHEIVFTTNWDVAFAYFSRSGKYEVIGTNEDGYTKVRISRDGEPFELSGLPAGTVSGVAFSHSERLMKLYVSSDTMPRNVFLYDLEKNEATQLTDTLNPEIDASDLVVGEVVRFQARDGMTIPGILYEPIGATAENKAPVMLWIHGGPGGQSRAGYRAEMQFLLNNGYGLFAVNNRGSSGYGKTFYAADDRKHGREPLWDCVDAKEWLKGQNWVDPERIGIMGGSYGGYMVLAALAFEPEEFSCGVDVFGVANWLLTLKNIPPYWESFREALYTEVGHPENDEEFLRATSPAFHGDKITRPLLVLQGANDPRVLQRESDDMVAAIRANGGAVEYIVFEDEGHGFRKSTNRIRGFNAVRDFLDTHLKGDPAASTQ
ncbi:S9 family peptidase [bacterium]|nr:MAG: S9 family peptidase [bacterium]RKZ18034.1 MAG: S9 family peptidase [bacterium]